MRRRIAAVSVAILALGLAGCGGSNDSSSGPSTGSDEIDGLTVTGKFGQEPTIKVHKLDVTKPESAVLVKGDGPAVTKDSTVNYRFAIVYGSNGKQVSSNYSEPSPQKLALSQQSKVITDAVVGQHIGSRVAIATPVTDLVGKDGAKQIGLNAKDDLVMVMDLISEAAKPLDAPKGQTMTPPKDVPSVQTKGNDVTGLDFSGLPAKPPSQMKVVTLIKGTGAPVKEGDSLTVDYFGEVWQGKTAFDQSYTREPATFTLTEGSLIKGWVKGLQGVPAGSRVMLIIPPDLGYGAQQSGSIPPNSTLVFVVDVLGVNL